MNERCVIDYHDFEGLKTLIATHYGIDLPRAYVRDVFGDSEVVRELRTYGADDPTVLANVRILLSKRVNLREEALDREALAESLADFLSRY